MTTIVLWFCTGHILDDNQGYHCHSSVRTSSGIMHHGSWTVPFLGPVVVVTWPSRSTDESASRFQNNTKPLYNQIQSLKNLPVVASKNDLYYRFYECLVLCTDVLYAVRRELKRLRRDELNLELCTNEVESKEFLVDLRPVLAVTKLTVKTELRSSFHCTPPKSSLAVTSRKK
jgi:hypothetical protein